MIRAVHEIDGIERIRLGSLEPGIITEEFAEGIAKLPKMCPHFHLSLQSGCDATLKRMNRRYTSSEYAEKCELLRKYFPNPALTTDVIVGFPGETEEEFKESYDFVDSIDSVSYTHLVYDMCKAMDKKMEIGEIYLVRKSGGKSGLINNGYKKERKEGEK